MNHNDTQAKERAILKKLAFLVVSCLILIILCMIGFAVPILAKLFEIPGGPDTYPNAWRSLLCVIGGTLGSSIAALVSAIDRISHGWELTGGDTYPSQEIKEKFAARMVPLYIVWPFLGSAMGLIVYVGVKAGYLITVEQSGQATFSRDGLMFLSFLGGLVSKKFIVKLQAMFDSLFG